MNGIDIFSGEAGINLAKVPCDFVIVKSTQGANYVSPPFKKQVKQALDLKKMTGIYHYVGGQGVELEAQNFYKAAKPYLGKVTLWLDWEEYQNSKWRNEAYLEQLLVRVKELVGVPVGIYAQASAFPWAICKRHGSPTWVAQYATDNAVYGYQGKPWNEGAYDCDIRQYTGEGHLTGWHGALDLNKGYIGRTRWAELCTDGAKPVEKPKPSKPTPSKSKAPARGKYRVVTSSGVKIRRAAGLKGAIADNLAKGEEVYINEVKKADGFWWGGYTGFSGKPCWVALSVVDGKEYMKKV